VDPIVVPQHGQPRLAGGSQLGPQSEMKPLIFFIVTLITLTYFVTFWQNRNERVKFRLFNQKVDISVGLLAVGIFLDGAIISALLIWLLY
jgi:hypothetical protein